MMHYLEMLTRLGIGSAHPGGYRSTLDLLASIPLPPGTSILEVGCGTGRTACLLAKMGYKVTAVDLHPTMIEKARTRSQSEQLAINFKVGDIRNIPCEAGQFDVILSESATNFVHADLALAEYYRVLKPGGVFLGREVIRTGFLTSMQMEEIQSFLGFAQLFSEKEWMHALETQSFTSVQLTDIKRLVDPNDNEQPPLPDEHQIVDEGVYNNEAIWQTSYRYTEILNCHKETLASALITGMKPHA